MFVNDGTLDIRLNVNNVFDNVYISELRSAIAAGEGTGVLYDGIDTCLLYTSPSPRDRTRSRMPSSA